MDSGLGCKIYKLMTENNNNVKTLVQEKLLDPTIYILV